MEIRTVTVFGDPMFMSVQIANEMGVPPPADRILTLQWMLGQSLQYDPGSTNVYSNFGYMVLGLIVEQLSGMDHDDYIKTAVLTPQDWIPSPRREIGTNCWPMPAG